MLIKNMLMKNNSFIIKFLTILTIYTGLAVSPVYAQVALTPQMYTINLGKTNQTWSFRLINFTNEPKPVIVSVINWSMDSHGNIIPSPIEEQSLAPWIQINPTSFTLPANGSQVIRFAIRPAVPLVPGEHRAMIFFSEQSSNNAQPNGTFRALFRLGAAIYARVPPYTMLGEISSIKPTAKGIEFKVYNAGNATTRMFGEYLILKKDDHSYSKQWVNSIGTANFKLPYDTIARGKLPLDADLPGLSRSMYLIFKNNLVLAPGSYILYLNGNFGTTIINRKLTFIISKKIH